jgi:hypothetical protein
MKNLLFPPRHAKKGGVVTATVMGVGGLIIGVIVILVITSTLLGANLLTSASLEENASQDLSDNFVLGIDQISMKIPTILTIVAVVFLFGVLILLVSLWKRSGTIIKCNSLHVIRKGERLLA